MLCAIRRVSVHFTWLIQTLVRWERTLRLAPKAPCLRFSFPWQRDDKSTALARYAFHMDCSSHEFHQLLNQGQTHACSLVLARQAFIQLFEWEEQPGYIFFRYSNPFIPNSDADNIPVFLPGDIDTEFPASLRELGSVP